MEVEIPTTTTNSSNLPVPVRVILPTTYQFLLNADDVNHLLEMRRIFYEKETERKLSKLIDHQTKSSNKPIRRRDMEWLSIVLPFVKTYNSHCGICASSKNYGRRLDTANSYLLRSYFYCQGRDCPFNCIVTIKENGKGFLCSRFSNGNIVDHRNAKRVARPNRSLNKTSDQQHVKRSLKSTTSLVQQWNQTLSDELTSDYNFLDQDFEQSTKRFLHTCSNLLQLQKNLRDNIEPNRLLEGVLQQISLSPFYVIIHTENSLQYYHSMLNRSNQQNTTNEIIIDNNDIVYPRTRPIAYAIVESIEYDEKKFFYYEFMLNNLDDTSFIPITLTYAENIDNSNTQTYILKSWFDRFHFDHEYLYKSSLLSLSNTTYVFPQPLIILIDEHRETPLNNSLLQFFNNETFKEYLMRTYTHVSSNEQFMSSRLILHVNSSLILIDFRTLVNKYVSIELRQLALWSSLLLFYTSTWHEIKQNWSLICEIFLNWGTNFVSLKSYEELCMKVATIENDSDIVHLMDSSDIIEDNEGDIDDDEIAEDVIDLSDFQNDHFYTKNMITNETNRYVSPYENDLRRIFNEKNQSKTALLSSWETLSNSDRSILKKIKGNWKWLHLLLKDYIPSIPLWSNLICSISNQFQSLDFNKRLRHLIISKNKRLNQIKQIQFVEHRQGRMDLFLNNIAKDLHVQVINADIKQ